MFRAHRSAIWVRVSVVALPMCGRTTQLSSVNRRLSVGRGSGDVTSKPAANIVLSFRALYSASWSTTPPRLVLMKTAVDFMSEKARSLNIFSVSFDRAQVANTKSDSCSSSSNETCFAPSFSALIFCVRLWYKIRETPNGCKRSATAEPMRPRPTMPTVLPFNVGPHNQSGDHVPHVPVFTA